MSPVLGAAPLMAIGNELMSRAIYLPTQEKPTTRKTNPQTEAPTAPRQGNPGSHVTFARNMESSPQW